MSAVRSRQRRLVILALLSALGAAAPPAAAHDFSILDVVLVFDADGRWHADLKLDLDALALGVSPELPSEELAAQLAALEPDDFERAIERAQQTLLRRVRLRFDGEPVRPHVAFPELDGPLARPGDPPTVLGTTARLSGLVPDAATNVTFFASRAFGPVRLTLFDQAAVAAAQSLLSPGEESAPHAIGTSGASGSAESGTLVSATRYIRLGFEHILPYGADHILFVLGLFLLDTRLRPLLWQISAFTLAHSVTLALAVLGVVALPPRLVETLIAASIAYVAIENLLTDRLHVWRPLLVFAFGLLHGLGFAGVLGELGLPDDGLIVALLAFNVGVELGQLAVIVLAFACVGWLRRRDDYRRLVVIPLSALIAAIGLWWAFERAVIGI